MSTDCVLEIVSSKVKVAPAEKIPTARPTLYDWDQVDEVV